MLFLQDFLLPSQSDPVAAKEFVQRRRSWALLRLVGGAILLGTSFLARVM